MLHVHCMYILNLLYSFHEIINICLFYAFVKCGYAGSNFPAFIFPSLVGRPIIRSTSKVGDIEVKVKFDSNL
jgi:hypothetical protein